MEMRQHVHWILTEKPTQHNTVMWQDALHQLFLQPLLVSKRLRMPLGKLFQAHPRHKEWLWW